MVQDEDGHETEMIQTLVDQKGLDLDAWIDAKSHYLSNPEKVRMDVILKREFKLTGRGQPANPDPVSVNPSIVIRGVLVEGGSG